MDDARPLVCVFFQLPPSDRLFMRIHDLAWLVLLPQLEKLTAALETLLVTTFSSTAMNTLLDARKVMAGKVIPLRDVMLTGRDYSRHYLDFVDGVSKDRMLSNFIKEAYNVLAQDAAKKTEEAQLALSEFREELESHVRRITSSFATDNESVSLFITQSSLIISEMVTAVEECRALLHECGDSFLNIKRQAFDLESFKCNPPSDAEFQLVREKWETLKNFLHDISLDWNLLEGYIEIPGLNRPTGDVTPPRDAVALRSISENVVSSEAPPDVPPPKKTKIPILRKFWQRVSTCFSSKPFC